MTDYIVEIGDIYIPEKPEVKMGELLIHKQVRIDEGLKDIYGNSLDLNSPYVTEAIFSIQLERLNEDGSYSPYGNVVIQGPGSKLVKLPPGKYRISERVPANYELVEIKGTGSEEGLLLYTVEIVSEELTDAIIINQLVNNRWVSDKDTVRNMLVCELGPVT